ncbi:MAG TPA: PIG-L deacetylase family protein [Candidatus Kryptonia bacterium]|nr:PIG-L deacetylase family protein [Candidatus Kryptonia bacterium]
MNVLVVSAHHDDLELGCGATVARLIEGGHSVTSLVMTHSGYRGPEGNEVRSRAVALREAQRASAVLGYQLVTLNEDTLDIAESDRNVCEILSVIRRQAIDTVFTHWHGDSHPPHQRVHRMVLHAARHLPRVMGFAANWYLGEESFTPRLFVPASAAHWQRKLAALRCYEDELRRTDDRWMSYVEHVSAGYGLVVGAERAEGFMIYKYVWDIANAADSANGFA